MDTNDYGVSLFKIRWHWFYMGRVQLINWFRQWLRYDKKFDQFREYIHSTWMSEAAIFPRDLWNLIDDESKTHTNNIGEAYSHKIIN